jgi:nucleoside-diphosphate-sugar epimerase
MSAGTTHVVSGASGFLGSHLTNSVLCDGDSVLALSRSTAKQSAEQRLKSAMLEANPRVDTSNPALHCVEAEITQPLCGVAPDSLNELLTPGGPRVFWHCAASLRWEWGRRKSVFEANVDGTRNALELAEAIKADLFVYVSTSYTCGTMHGQILEELHCPGSFNNVYEESKHHAERLVIDHPQTTMRTIVLRPSIIVGSSENYTPSGGYTGLYGFIKELTRFKRMLGDSEEVVRFRADGSAELSFIPVDHVVIDAKNVARSELRNPTKRIYHITSDSGPTLDEQADYIFEKVELGGRIVLVNDEIRNPTPLERFFGKRMEFFSGYTGATKRFARSIQSLRSISLDDLQRYIDSELQLQD